MIRATDRPRVAASKRSFDFAGYRVRLEAGHGDADVPEVVAFIVEAINAAIDRSLDVGPDQVVTDGFGSEWLKCDRNDCDLHVVRPGKAQCVGDHDEWGCGSWGGA